MTINKKKYNLSEEERIRSIYSERDTLPIKEKYAWYQPNARYQASIRERMIWIAFTHTLGRHLGDLHVLDVGCGTGKFLRMLVEWGVQPRNMLGTEFLEDRLQTAKNISPAEMRWYLGSLDLSIQEQFDLVSANTVFSSILGDTQREDLANEMWEKLRPGGWMMVFDFRYNNPNNPNVRKVTRQELDNWFPSNQTYYMNGILIPPISRKVVSRTFFFAEMLTLLFPVLRSHFVFMAQK